MRFGNQEQIVASLGQLHKLGAKLVRALKPCPDMMDVTETAQRGGKASLAAKVAGEMLGPGVRYVDFRCGKALRCYQRGSKRNLHVEFTVGPFAR